MSLPDDLGSIDVCNFVKCQPSRSEVCRGRHKARWGVPERITMNSSQEIEVRFTDRFQMCSGVVQPPNPPDPCSCLLPLTSPQRTLPAYSTFSSSVPSVSLADVGLLRSWPTVCAVQAGECCGHSAADDQQRKHSSLSTDWRVSSATSVHSGSSSAVGGPCLLCTVSVYPPFNVIIVVIIIITTHL